MLADVEHTSEMSGFALSKSAKGWPIPPAKKEFSDGFINELEGVLTCSTEYDSLDHGCKRSVKKVRERKMVVGGQDGGSGRAGQDGGSYNNELRADCGRVILARMRGAALIPSRHSHQIRK